VKASALISAASVNVGNGDSVGSITPNATLTPLVHRNLTFSSSAPPSDVTVAPGATANIAPGTYGRIVAKPNSTLTLSAGTYLAASFDVEPNATLQLDTSSGTVEMYVQSGATWKGTTSGDPTQFILTYLGSDVLRLQGSLDGTVLVPSGTLELDNGSYRGTYYGNDVVIKPGVMVTKVPTPLLIDGLTVSNTAPCVGQETEVTLSAPSLPGADIRIQGLPGSHQFVQFDGAATKRMIFATVITADGHGDFASVPIQLQQCTPAAGSAPVALHFWEDTSGKPNLVDLHAGTYDGTGQQIPIQGPATYVWSFGDGQTATTTTPLVQHDYTAAVDPLAQYTYFTASVAVTTSAGTSSAQKVIPIWSLYAANRAKGIIQPPSSMSVSPTSLGLTVTNYEPTPISITQANVELIPCDPALDSRPQSPQALAVTVPAGGTAIVNVTPPARTPDVCAMGIHLLGSAPAGNVYSDAYARIGPANPLLRQAITDPATIALLNQASTLTADPNRFDDLELRRLVARGALPALPPPLPPGTTYGGDPTCVSGSQLVNGSCHCDPSDTTQNALECVATSNWVQGPAEMLNAFKGDFIMDHGCGQIGLLMSAVGQRYSHTSTLTKNRVEVRHATMSSDRISSTSAIQEGLPYLARMDPDKLQYGFPGTNGVGPDNAYSISQMTDHYCVTDPDGDGGDPGERACDKNGNCQCPPGTWRMGGEYDPSQDNECTGDVLPVPPLVVRPTPDSPAQNLDAVGDRSLGIDGHYRFFMYSHADTPSVGAALAPLWAQGTESMVCSSFNRLAITQASGSLPGLSLWPSRSPQLPNPVPDGMRFYPVPERQVGGKALQTVMYNSVQSAVTVKIPLHIGTLNLDDLCGAAASPLASVSVIGALTVVGACDLVATNIGNQIVNCFASDACNDMGNTWQNPGFGVAVSPDDISNWDPYHITGIPNAHGTYGYREPAIYLPSTYSHDYQWFPKQDDGSITVVVKDDHKKAVPNATIILDSEVQPQTTGQDGTLHIPNVRATTSGSGHYVEAQIYQGTPVPLPPAPTPSPDAIQLLPWCNYGENTTTPCQAWMWCPTGLLQSQTFYTVPDANYPGVDYIYGCYPPPSPTPGCDLWNDATFVPVGAGQDPTVVLTLCLGAGCENGVPGQCAQNCMSDANCDTDRWCGADGTCDFPSKVEMQTNDATFSVANAGLGSPFSYSPSIDFTCDSSVSSSSDPSAYWFCHFPAQSGVVPPGGLSYYVQCIPDGSGNPDSQVQWSVCCQVDPQTGEMYVTNDLRLLDGCGPNAEDKKDAVQWEVDLGPTQRPNPMPTAGWTGVSSCYSDNLTVKNACDDNSADLNDITYSALHP